jgi:hypothetical protein
MRSKILYISIVIWALVMISCAPVEDDIFTTARITVTTGDDTAITRVQGQVRLTNVNTRQVVTSSDFEGSSVNLELLRGAYQIDIEGVVTCQQSDGQTRARQFRCQSDYAEFISDDSGVTLNIIFLD